VRIQEIEDAKVYEMKMLREDNFAVKDQVEYILPLCCMMLLTFTPPMPCRLLVSSLMSSSADRTANREPRSSEVATKIHWYSREEVELIWPFRASTHEMDRGKGSARETRWVLSNSVTRPISAHGSFRAPICRLDAMNL
jgi:hypothetical protein